MILQIVVVSSLLILLRFIWKTKTKPLHIIWDLDATIIASHLIEKVSNISTQEFPDYFDQIDDDFPFQENIPNTRTWFRPGTKTILWLFSKFTIQHVFTSAQGSYTDNVLKGLEMWTNRKYFQVIKHRDQYEAHYLPKNGKDIREIIKESLPLSSDYKTEEELLKRSILLDDQLRYLKPHPYNGILVKPYKDIKEGKNDIELWRVFLMIFVCVLFDDVRTILSLFSEETLIPENKQD